MLRNILCYSGRKTGLIGTITHQIGEEEYSPVNTTPGKDLLRTYFDKMDSKHMDCCVIEASSHGLVQGRLDDTEISYGAFTKQWRNISDANACSLKEISKAEP